MNRFPGHWSPPTWNLFQGSTSVPRILKGNLLSSCLKSCLVFETIWPYSQRKSNQSLYQKIFNLLLLVDNYFGVIFQGGTVQGVEHRRQVDYKTQNENDLKFQIWINIVLQIIIHYHYYHQIPITIIITIINIIIIIIITIIIIIKSLAVGLVAASWVFPPNPWWHRSWLLWQGGKCICICICDKVENVFVFVTRWEMYLYLYLWHGGKCICICDKVKSVFVVKSHINNEGKLLTIKGHVDIV